MGTKMTNSTLFTHTVTLGIDMTSDVARTKEIPPTNYTVPLEYDYSWLLYREHTSISWPGF